MAAAAEPKVSLRILMLGDSGVGKSSIMKRFIDNKFSPSMTSTIGIDYATKVIDSGGSPVKLTVWDTAGQERFRSMAAGYYKGSDGVVMVYDITVRESLENVRQWMRDLRGRVGDGVAVLLVGNKADLAARRQVTEASGRELAESVGAAAFVEVSCRSGAGVNELFQQLTDRVLAARAAASSAPAGKGGRTVRVTDDDDDGAEKPAAGSGCC
ncbi:hypothetical protein FNF27_05858 [Cafeteria roenbergensis]|uniref:Uncharacterized protein n=1 Tax=Cafeteria roenbergensis TaxID=33653 RepID=A0A5A8E6C7_CAFRO|nr:hypothetical protein FNF29_02602 [Cafeteria roenbergensis]KAA0172634.1 hypothetical protein FNF27_05858 [Cafeteria roenbergensis]|eukprot:KAA0154382.1 hypothetical protein FNF29_02602 [Cafeteria roenbergensis]